MLCELALTQMTLPSPIRISRRWGCGLNTNWVHM